ncbi:hypothetical protein WA538_003445, partial [Blastocystis sp. DL]
MEWKSVSPERIRHSIEHVCREMGPEESQANTESDPYSITLPNGEQLHMVPVPMDLEVALLNEAVPTEDDLIIPHPSFHINDLIHLEVIDSLQTNPKRVPSSEEETLDDVMFADIEQAILSFIRTGRPLSHFYTILLPKLSETQWTSIVQSPSLPHSLSTVQSFASLCSSHSCCRALLKHFYPLLATNLSAQSLLKTLFDCSELRHASNDDLRRLHASLLQMWNDVSLV